MELLLALATVAGISVPVYLWQTYHEWREAVRLRRQLMAAMTCLGHDPQDQSAEMSVNIICYKCGFLAWRHRYETEIQYPRDRIELCPN